MSIYYDTSLAALGPIAADARAAEHIHADWIDFGAMRTDDNAQSWSSGELAVIDFACKLYAADGFVADLAAVDPDTRRRMLDALGDLLGGFVS